MNDALSQYMRPDDVNTSGGAAAPQTGAVNLSEDPDSQLGLRGSLVSSEIRTVSELMARWAELRDDERERAVHRLGIGKPMRGQLVDEYGNPRFPTADEVGIARDDSGRVLISPDDPTLRDRDLDEDLIEKTPEEVVSILQARLDGEGEDRDDEAFYEELMRRDNLDLNGGGGAKGAKKKRPKPTSAIDRTAAYASEKSIER